MPNPFPAKFNSTCDSCGNEIYEEEEIYAIDGDFLCGSCADANGNVCECGNYKKEEYEECFECKME